MDTPTFIGLYLFVADLPRTIAFYERLGFEVERVSAAFARASVEGGCLLEFGTAELTRSYDPTWAPPGPLAKSTINLQLRSREAVDQTFEQMVQAGYVGHLAPCDPPWEARFAILEDPDGNYIGLHSERDVSADRTREKRTAGGGT